MSVPSSMGKMGLPELSRGAREALRGAEDIAVLDTLDFFFGAPAILMNNFIMFYHLLYHHLYIIISCCNNSWHISAHP